MDESFLISIMTAAAISLIVYALGSRWARRSHIKQQRLSELLSNDGRTGSIRGTSEQILTKSSRAFGWLLPDDRSVIERERRRLIQAGFYSSLALPLYFVFRLLCILIPPIAAWILASFWGQKAQIILYAGGILGAIGVVLPGIVIDRLVERRHKQLQKSVPDCLDLLIVCFQSGLSIQSSFSLVVEELGVVHPDLSRELQMVERDIELGVAIDLAMRRLADRTGYRELRALSTFIQESMRFGTPLSDAFREHAEMLRLQREQEAEETAQKAAVRLLLPTMLLIFPAVFIVLAGPAAIQIQDMFSGGH